MKRPMDRPLQVLELSCSLGQWWRVHTKIGKFYTTWSNEVFLFHFLFPFPLLLIVKHLCQVCHFWKEFLRVCARNGARIWELGLQWRTGFWSWNNCYFSKRDQVGSIVLVTCFVSCNFPFTIVSWSTPCFTLRYVLYGYAAVFVFMILQMRYDGKFCFLTLELCMVKRVMTSVSRGYIQKFSY